MSSYTDNDEHHIWFDSLTEMEKEMPPRIQRYNAALWQSEVMGVGGHRWFGCDNAVEAMRLIKNGWPALQAALAPIQERLRQALELKGVTSAQVEVRRRKRHRSDHGDTLDMHRVWGGQLDTAWERPVKENRMVASQRYASIFVDSGVSCGVHSEDTLWRTAAAMVMVDTLTKMGINTEVWSGASGYNVWPGGPQYAFAGVRVKEYTQPINEDRLVSMLSVAFFRVWMFGAYMSAPYQVEYNVGYPYHTGFIKPLRDRVANGERVFRLGSCLSFESAVAEVTKVVDTLKTDTRSAA